MRRPVATFRVETRRKARTRVAALTLGVLVLANIPSPVRAWWRAEHHEVVTSSSTVHTAHLVTARVHRFVDIGDLNRDGVDEYEPTMPGR